MSASPFWSARSCRSRTVSLIEEWAAWEALMPPFVLARDEEVLIEGRSGKSLVTVATWNEAYSDDQFGAPGDGRLHLGLLPQPFCGNLRRATIYILLLNPGLGSTDYYGEYE